MVKARTRAKEPGSPCQLTANCLYPRLWPATPEKQSLLPMLQKGNVCPVPRFDPQLRGLMRTTRNRLWGAFASVVLASTAWAQAADSSATEKAVTAAEQQWLKSQQTNNPDLMAPLLADNFVQTDSTGKVTTRLRRWRTRRRPNGAASITSTSRSTLSAIPPWRSATSRAKALTMRARLSMRMFASRMCG
jgi:hypothetical protein